MPEDNSHAPAYDPSGSEGGMTLSTGGEGVGSSPSGSEGPQPFDPSGTTGGESMAQGYEQIAPGSNLSQGPTTAEQVQLAHELGVAEGAQHQHTYETEKLGREDPVGSALVLGAEGIEGVVTLLVETLEEVIDEHAHRVEGEDTESDEQGSDSNGQAEVEQDGQDDPADSDQDSPEQDNQGDQLGSDQDGGSQPGGVQEHDSSSDM